MTQGLVQSGWDVGRNSARCAACGAVLQPGQACWALLRYADEITGGDGVVGAAAAEKQPSGAGRTDFQRIDFCEGCWDAAKAHEEDTVSFWKTSVPESGKKPRMLVDDNVLIDLFNSLENRLSDEDTRLRFVLALLLLRKKLLKLEGTAAGTRPPGDSAATPEVWRMRPREGEAVDVVNPQMTAADTVSVSERLSAILAEEAM